MMWSLGSKTPGVRCRTPGMSAEVSVWSPEMFQAQKPQTDIQNS
jgi:hypothetical protein